ncbi:hypothetical protein JVU11DRAFT_1809 [Chiua virens]|nr:hypothetical protein JVU11DRAFT_1809 [Chiua virens]
MSKKRVCTGSVDDATPKRRKFVSLHPTPPHSPHKHSRSLPTQLSRLDNLHSALQHAISYALATCAVAPSEHTGIIRNVLNHISIATYSGFITRFDAVDLKRLCWIWEWNHASPPPSAAPSTDDDHNPFLVPTAPPPPKDWARGSMGFIVTPTSHYSKTAGKRVPVYGIGIEVDMDMTGGMAAVARWTADADKRRAEFRSKLESWVDVLISLPFPPFPNLPFFPQHHSDVTPIPNVPQADLPQLIVNNAQPSSLTRALASASPKGAAILANVLPSSPSPPSKFSATCEFPIPFSLAKPHSGEPSPSKPPASLLHTPSSRLKRADPLAGLLTPKTPARKRLDTEGPGTLPTTPVHQSGPDAQTAPSTPSTSRRQAIYERVRLKSLASYPGESQECRSRRWQAHQRTDSEIRPGRDPATLLARPAGFFTSVVASSATTAIPTTRKRKVLPASDVVAAVIKSSPVPVSTLEASESLKLLTTLCPFFLRQLDINGEEWFEMPPTAPTSDTTESSALHDVQSPTKSGMVPPLSLRSKVPPPSPGSKAFLDSAEQLLTRSPRRVKREAGGIRQVREIIRRELELHD